jgi:dipeptidyl aminopeptidase/acylaminoacyl peptidase
MQLNETLDATHRTVIGGLPGLAMKLVRAAAVLIFSTNAAAASHPFDAHDLAMLNRISDPQLAPNGKWVAYTLRETDYAANKGVTGIWLLQLDARTAQPQRLTDLDADATSPRWSADAASLYYTAKSGATTQIWRRDAGGRKDPVQVSNLPLDINSFKLAPDGRHLLLSSDVFPACAQEADVLACTRTRLLAISANKAKGRLYDELFVRHWDVWADGRRSQLFAAAIGADGRLGTPLLLTRGIDADTPSKPFGDDTEYAFSPDSRTVYFDARIAGHTEAWSTNFDIYAVPTDGSTAPRNLTAMNLAWDGYPVPSADGKTLYYLAMKRPGLEADRFAVMALDLASGATREIDPQWDRSAASLTLSDNGHALQVTTDDNGDRALFSIDPASGKVMRLTGPGQVEGFSALAGHIVYALSTLKMPAELFQLGAGDKPTQLTHVNADRLAQVKMGDYEFFTYKGAEGATVQGYVVKPVGYQADRKYPVAFLIHGGPEGSFNNQFGYRWNPQTYAGSGFAVVTVNFHGSRGYGQAFTDSISGDWGGKPLQDLKLGWAAALARYRYLDGARACALGGSYGGYLVYWMAGNWSEPWKCLVAHGGVFDRRGMAYSTDELWFEDRENDGLQWERPEDYERFNPVNFVRYWHVPMLVIHNERDFRVPLTQGLSAFTALQRRGIPSEFLSFPDENHWVQKPQNSVQWHDTVNAWLKRWLAD